MEIYSNPKDATLSQKCKEHLNYLCDMINLKKNAKKRRICIKCQQKENCLFEELLNIRELVDINEDTILETYPPLLDLTYLPQLVKLTENGDSSYIKEIDEFFDEMLQAFLLGMEKKKLEVKQYLSQKNEMKQKIINEYNKIANLGLLSNAVFTDSTGSDDELEKLINSTFQNIKSNTQKIEQLMKEIKVNQKELQLEECRNQIKQIVESISNIKVFGTLETKEKVSEVQLKKSTETVSEVQLKQSTEIVSEVQLKQSSDLLSQVQLQKSTVFERTQISRNQLNHLVFENNTDSQNHSQLFMDFILDPSANYIIQLEIQKFDKQTNYFYFGIMRDQNKHNSLLFEDNLCYFEENNESGVNKLIKGTPITQNNTLTQRSFEFRLNVSKQFLRIGTLPNYETVVEVDNSDSIKPNGEYRFMMSGLGKQSKMTITQIQKVDSFDNLM